MDAHRFDDVLRRSSVARRPVVSLGLGLLTTLAGVTASEARKRKKRKKQKKPKPSAGCTTSQKLCDGRCIPSNQCCTNADCAAGAPRCCAGTCIRTADCCTDAECSGGKRCQEGTCRCAAGAIGCAGVCCSAAPGFTARSQQCLLDGRCVCDYETDDNPGACPGVCRPSCGISTACATPANFCGYCCS